MLINPRTIRNLNPQLSVRESIKALTTITLRKSSKTRRTRMILKL